MTLPSWITDKTHKYLQNGRSWYQRKVNGIKVITVHHTASNYTGTDDEILTKLMSDHTKQDWPGLSYHFIYIPKSKKWYKINELEDVTWHDSSNWDSIGVCVHGYFHPDVNGTLDDVDLANLKKMLDWLCTENPEFPADQSNVVGHRDRQATACPGNWLYPYVKEYKDKLGEVAWGQTNSDTSPELGFDPTKRLSDELWEQFNFNKAKGLPRKTSVDTVYKEYNALVDEIENQPDCSDQIESAVTTATEALTVKHKAEVQKITDDYLKEIDTLKANHIAEVESLKKYTDSPTVEGIKEVGRWVLFGAVSFVLTWGIDSLLPSLNLDPTTKLYLMTGITSLQRYVDKYIHEQYLKVKAENAIANAVNFVEGRVVEEIKKLPIRGLAPF